MAIIPLPAKRVPKATMKNLKTVRLARGENQQQFWSRFGVTQSGGSRYESGRDIPEPTAMLLLMYLNGMVDDAMLEKATKLVKTARAAT